MQVNNYDAIKKVNFRAGEHSLTEICEGTSATYHTKTDYVKHH